MKLRSRYKLTSCLALFAAATIANAAAQKAVPVTFGKDDRQIADTRKSPWNAIGRVNNKAVGSSYSRTFSTCSGTLIAPDVVLTMARCIQELGKRPDNLHFSTGDLRGDYQELAGVKCVRFPAPRGSDDGPFDVALLMLDKKLQAHPLPLSGESDFEPATKVSYAGYSGDRPYVLSVHEDCSVRFTTSNGLIVTDCDTATGGAGGPILLHKDGGWQVAGLMALADEQHGSGGPLASSWKRLMEDAVCPRPVSSGQ